MKEKIVFVLNPRYGSYEADQQQLDVLLDSSLKLSKSGKVDLRLVLDTGSIAWVSKGWIMEKLIEINKSAEVVISPGIVSGDDELEDLRFIEYLRKNSIKWLDEFDYIIKSIEEGYQIIRWSYVDY